MIITGNITVTAQKKDGADSLYIGENFVSFKAYEQIYDAKAENKKAYIHYSCFCFEAMAERIKKMNLKPGSKLMVSGELTIPRSFQLNNGSSATVININVKVANYLPIPVPKKEDGEQTPQKPVQEKPAQPTSTEEDLFSSMDFQPLDDAELPF